MLIFAIAACAFGVVVAIAHFVIGERAALVPIFRQATEGVLASREMQGLVRAMFHLHTVVWAALGVAVLLNRMQEGSGLMPGLASLIFGVSGVTNLSVMRRPHPGGVLLLLAAASSAADIWFN